MASASKSISKGKKDELNFLLELAKSLGATEAKIVDSDKIVVEDRVVLKCKTGCPMYGHKLVCPIHVYF